MAFPVLASGVVLACSAPPQTSPLSGQQYSLSGTPPTRRAEFRSRSCAAPRYPEWLRRAGIQGQVEVEFIIDTTGQVVPTSVRVVRTTNNGFNAASVASIRSCRFVPAELDGRRIPVRVTTPLDFTIDRVP